MERWAKKFLKWVAIGFVLWVVIMLLTLWIAGAFAEEVTLGEGDTATIIGPAVIEITRAAEVEPEPEVRRLVSYVWNAGIAGTGAGGGAWDVTQREALLRYEVDFIAWSSCGTAGMVAEQYPGLDTSGAFMMVRKRGVDGETDRWNRHQVKHIIWSPEHWGPWDVGYDEMRAVVGGEAEFICGNVGWGSDYSSPATVAYLRRYGDALECYYRPFGWRRTKYDLIAVSAFLRAVCEPAGKRFYLLPNAVIDPPKDRPDLPQVIMPLEGFSVALELAAERSDGIGVWGWDSLPDGHVVKVNEVVARDYGPKPRPTHKIVLDYGTPEAWYYAAAKFRIAHFAGLECAAELPGEALDLPELELFVTKPDSAYLRAWWKNPSEMTTEEVLSHEREWGERLKSEVSD